MAKMKLYAFLATLICVVAAVQVRFAAVQCCAVLCGSARSFLLGVIAWAHAKPRSLPRSPPPHPKQQACCVFGGTVAMLDGGQLNPTVFGHSGLPLTPIFQCIVNSTFYADGWTPNARMDPCNMFSCNCDHCYGALDF